MKLFIITIIFLYSFASYSLQMIVFSAGAPLSSYQGKIIVPKLKKAFSKLGYSFGAKSYPSARSLIESNSGNVDGELHRVKYFHKVSNNKFPNLIRIDYKMVSIWLSVFSTNKDIEINSWKDLSKYKVAYYRGRKNVESIVSKFMHAKHVFETNDDTQAMRMLVRKRVDFVISESFDGKRIINTNRDFKNIFEVKKMEETQIFSYIHKKHKPLIKDLIKELERAE